jgi:hypothetical protein
VAEKAAKNWAEKLAMQEAVDQRNREYWQQLQAEKAEKAAAKAAEKAAKEAEKQQKAAVKAAVKEANKQQKELVWAKVQEALKALHVERIVNELLPAKLREVESSQEQEQGDEVMQLLRSEKVRRGIMTLIQTKVSDVLSTKITYSLIMENVSVEEFPAMTDIFRPLIRNPSLLNLPLRLTWCHLTLLLCKS